MDPYSALLGLTMVVTGLAWAALVGSVVKRHARRKRLARALAAVAIGMGGAAATWHVLAGHRAGTEFALAPLAFVREHPALFAVLGAAAVAWVVARRPSGAEPGV